MKASELPAHRAACDDGVILDVRSGYEFTRGHVPGAVHFPFWAAAFRPLPIARATAPIVVYCGHGPRAWIARTLLGWRGATNVCLLEGHMAAWRRAGGPLQR